jgi:hypothetical protein
MQKCCSDGWNWAKSTCLLTIYQYAKTLCYFDIIITGSIVWESFARICSCVRHVGSSELDRGKMLLGTYLMSVYHRYVLLLCILGEVSTGIKYSGL